jgi:hypothetical protein
MAANYTVDQVLMSVFEDNDEEELKDKKELKDSCDDEDKITKPHNEIVHVLQASTINAADVLKSESVLWLEKIYRRLAGRRSIQQPFYCEIQRDIPLGIFKALVRAIKSSRFLEFKEPNCYIAGNKKGEVISITAVSILTKLFSWLSHKNVAEVKSYFQRTLKGNRNNHVVRILVSVEKDFGLVYNFKRGQLTVSFHYGEWNSFGFPQHSCTLQS